MTNNRDSIEFFEEMTCGDFHNLLTMLVRCKDCKHVVCHNSVDGWYCTLYMMEALESDNGDYVLSTNVPPDHFCGYGERNE